MPIQIHTYSNGKSLNNISKTSVHIILIKNKESTCNAGMHNDSITVLLSRLKRDILLAISLFFSLHLHVGHIDVSVSCYMQHRPHLFYPP